MRKSSLPEPATLPLWSQVGAFIGDLRKRQFKAKSIRSIEAALLRFCAFMVIHGRNEWTQITAVDLEQYQASLVEMKVSTQCNYLTHLRSLFGWLEKSHQLFENPAAKLRIAKRPKPLIIVPTERQMDRLLEALNVNTVTGLRDRAWLELAYATGARRIELTRLKMRDVKLEQSTVRLFGKGDKERLVPVGKEAAYWLARYIREARPKLLMGKETDALWIAAREGRPLSYAAIQRQLRTLCQKVNAPKGLFSPHNLRRACMTHMLKHGASPLMLKEMLGHVRTATLTHYLKHTVKDVKKTHSHCSPGK